MLKNALSRNAMENAWLDEVHIVPLNSIEVPKTEDLKPVPDLVQEALTNRVEIERSKINIDSQKILARGTRNGLLPSLQAFAELTNHGLSGPVNPLYNGCCGAPDVYFVGGNGNAFSQIFRRNFPNYSAGFSLNIPFRNRAAQADYVTDTLQLRQNELQLQRTANQVTVDVKTAVIGLQQARARYETAVDTRVLAEQSLKDEQNRFQHGVSSVPWSFRHRRIWPPIRTPKCRPWPTTRTRRSTSTWLWAGPSMSTTFRWKKPAPDTWPGSPSYRNPFQMRKSRSCPSEKQTPAAPSHRLGLSGFRVPRAGPGPPDRQSRRRPFRCAPTWPRPFLPSGCATPIACTV